MNRRRTARSAPSRVRSGLVIGASEPGRRVRTIAIINQKGGSGKTTTAINLAAALARQGRRVLLVDVDPQSHCALGLAVPESRIDLTIGDAMLAADHRPPERSRLVWEAAKNLDLIPSTTRLAGLEAPRGGLAERPDRDRRLAMALGHLSGGYDWCLIDCPPFIGLLTFNALRAADEVLIPVETGFFALQGAVKQVNTIRALGRKAGALTPYRVLATLHDPESVLACEILSELGRRFEGRLIPTAIRYDAKLKESVSAGVSVLQFDPESSGSQDYTALAQFFETAPRLQAEAVVVEPVAAVIVPAEIRDGGSGRAAASSLTLARGETPLPRFVGVASRAAELAARARQLSARSHEINQRLEADPQVARVLREIRREIPDDNAAVSDRLAAIRPLAGARVTSRGVLFMLDASAGALVEVEIEWDGTAPQRESLRFNRETGMHEALIPLPSGLVRYRLMVDGRPVAGARSAEAESGSAGAHWDVVLVPAFSEHETLVVPPSNAALSA